MASTSIIMVFVLLALAAVTTIDAQSPGTSPTKSPPVAHAPRVSHSHATMPPASAPSPATVEPPSSLSPASSIPSSSISGPPAEAPGPAASSAVSRGFSVAGSVAVGLVAAALII